MITHAGASDLPILERASGARPTALFDVQLAAGFVGLGLPSLGSLVSVLLGVRLDKSEQLADWSARPLSPAVRKYAAADVEYLFPLSSSSTTACRSGGARGGRRASASCCGRTPTGGSIPTSPGGGSRARRHFGARRRASRSPSPRGASAARADGPRAAVRAARSGLAAVVGRPPKTRDEVMKLRGVNRMS